MHIYIHIYIHHAGSALSDAASIGALSMVLRGAHVPQRWCAQMSAMLTFAIVLLNTGFLPIAALCALCEMFNPTLGKRGRVPPKVLSNREMQESYGQLIAELTHSGQSTQHIANFLETECNINTDKKAVRRVLKLPSLKAKGKGKGKGKGKSNQKKRLWGQT